MREGKKIASLGYRLREAKRHLGKRVELGWGGETISARGGVG